LVESRTGPLSPLDACVTMCQIHQNWLLKSGAKFAENIRVDSSGKYLCEVSPLVSYDGEGLLRSYPEILQLPLVLPSRFEREAKIPGAPLMQSVHIAPGAPTAGGDEWTKQADVQMPILPASAGQVPKQDLTDSEAMHHSKATSELIGRASSRQGLEASPGERLEVDPDEELHFREAAICAHEALDMLMKIEAGEFKDIAVQKMTRLRGLDDKVEGEEKEKDQEDEEEEDELGSDNSDIETRIEKIEALRAEEEGSSSSEVEDDDDPDASKKQRSRYYFTKLGPRSQVYQVARSVRCKRAKAYGHEYADPNLPNAPPLTSKQKAAKRRARDGYLEYNPDMLYNTNWYTLGGAWQRKLDRPGHADDNDGEGKLDQSNVVKAQSLKDKPETRRGRRAGVEATVAPANKDGVDPDHMSSMMVAMKVQASIQAAQEIREEADAEMASSKS